MNALLFSLILCGPHVEPRMTDAADIEAAIRQEWDDLGCYQFGTFEEWRRKALAHRPLDGRTWDDSGYETNIEWKRLYRADTGRNPPQ